jgi:2-octaprenyl-6-methoxyphenol hydroxylase
VGFHKGKQSDAFFLGNCTASKGRHVMYDVCIIGTGPVGGALACRLAAAGLRVAAIDRAALPPMEHPDFDGRAYAIAAGSRRLLEDAGLWDMLPLPAGPIEQIRVSDGKIGRPASRLHLHFDAGTLHEPGGALGWMVEARSFRMALNRRLHQLNSLDVFAPAEASVIRGADSAAITLSTGESFTARLVVAAEGRDSRLRREAGITAQRWPYHQSGIVCAIAHERPHSRTALEHFLPGGPFAQLPMAGNDAERNLSAIVWTERSADAARYMALDDASFGREITRRLGTHLGAVRPVGRRWIYPLSAMYVHRIVAERLAIVGDAAHGIHPIAGQGLNLGLRDAIALGQLLITAHAAGADLGAPALLQRYQRARRVDVISMLAATDGLDRLFSTDNSAVRLVRDFGLAAVHRMPALKRAFMLQAMGFSRQPSVFSRQNGPGRPV